MLRRYSRRQINAFVGASPLIAAGLPAHAQLSDTGGAAPSVAGLLDLAVEGYVYGYPLVTMEFTRRVMTNVVEPKGTHAPMGQFANLREYPTAAFKDVTAPNADTLYSSTWIDVAKEPYILHVPDEKGRYYLMPMLEAWTNIFASPGTRTTGTGAGNFAIAGPSWVGELPSDVELLRSSTNLVWVLGRTYCTGSREDYAAVHAIQDKYSLTPLSAWGKPYKPPAGKVDHTIDTKTPVRAQVESLGTVEFFTLLAELMKQNPPYAADAPILARLARIGLVPGTDFDRSKLTGVGDVDSVPKLGVERISAHFGAAGEDLNGWVFPKPAGRYGTDYIQRALIARFGLGANLLDDAVYPTARADSEGRKLEGAHKYVIRFPKGALPPVRGFWSLTMYDGEFFFVANRLNRYTLSVRNSLKTESDGTVELLVQADDPGPQKEANWLPAPKGEFMLMLRLYWPKVAAPSILDGTWKPPAITRV
jgi:hypothetical protein